MNHIFEDVIYYIFFPISMVVKSRVERKYKKQFILQLKELESYKILKKRESCSFFNEEDNKE